MERVLECHSRGNREFSALFAGPIIYKGIQAETIESLYQGSKVVDGRARHELYGKPGWVAVKFDVKGRAAEKFLVGALEVPAGMGRHFYNAIWFKYLDTRPDLVETAMGYDRFNDLFARKGGISQAESIRLYVEAKRAGKDPWETIPPELVDRWLSKHRAMTLGVKNGPIFGGA